MTDAELQIGLIFEEIRTRSPMIPRWGHTYSDPEIELRRNSRVNNSRQPCDFMLVYSAPVVQITDLEYSVLREYDLTDPNSIEKLISDLHEL